VASSAIIGHEVSQLTLRAHANLYSGIRNEIVFFNSNFLFFDYIKKANFLKKLSNAGSEYHFTTARLEFFPLIKRFARECGGTEIEFNKFMDLTRALNKIDIKDANTPGEFFSSADPVIFLFNNDNLGSRSIMKEIKLKNYFTISVADSNSLNTNPGGFFTLYGNDDSRVSLRFYGNFLQHCLKVKYGTGALKKKVTLQKKKYLSNENEEFIIKHLLKKKQLKKS
jgi:hypothetical protein